MRSGELRGAQAVELREQARGIHAQHFFANADHCEQGRNGGFRFALRDLHQGDAADIVGHVGFSKFPCALVWMPMARCKDGDGALGILAAFAVRGELDQIVGERTVFST